MRLSHCWKNAMASTRQRSLTSTLVSFIGICVIFVRLFGGMGYVANVVYIEAKERSKELLDISKAKLDDVDDDLRRTFQSMEEVCSWTFRNPKVCLLNSMGMTVRQSA
jgi:hypothetical protein